MTPSKCALMALTAFGIVIMINGGPDDPVKGGALLSAVLAAAAVYAGLRYLGQRFPY